ncbi:B-cell linker protein isoform X2 [Thalassophryne amazonica]|uniref:B-cell linker protein isoform X2 n=1 Tax=Thalassophryne amazonica TaxID=390379 RepID=UPI001471570C|nr:B-cell linker protein isoform X2 [Thalassophryne amazonica]
MNLPSKEECESWDQEQVAFFLCSNKMQECAATVNRLKINGLRFLNLSDSDISKFSLIHQPQLQKIVQGIRKNDGGFLNKIRRLRSKPLPKVPARDYRDDEREDDELSDFDYDNEMYEDPRENQDGSYEPPPSHSDFTIGPSISIPIGEYLDSCHNRPQLPPKKPRRPDKACKELPPEPTPTGSDEEDYIEPDGGNDDNYIEPEESPPADHLMHGVRRPGRHPVLPKPSPGQPPTPDFYEVPDQQERCAPANRPCPAPAALPLCLPPIANPRMNMNKSPVSHVQEHPGDDEYEICDPDDNSSSSQSTNDRPPVRPKPLPRDRSPKPPHLRPKPDLKPKECRTLPVIHTDHNPHPKTHSLDMKRPIIPIPQLFKPHISSQTETGRVGVDIGLLDEDKEAGVYNKPWYARTCDRKTAEHLLIQSNKDGAFMVRKSSGQDTQQPYTLVVLYKSRVYNIPIRFLQTTRQYALGKEKAVEEYFSSVSHIIETHQRNPLVLIDSQSNNKDTTKLCYPINL